jgi:glucose-6-phosphate isomerase
MDAFARDVIESGDITGVLHIGIGGSDLGPRLIADALSAIHAPQVKLRFAENVDGDSINRAVADLDPAKTLVIVVSKSFGTQETLMNGTAAREWLNGGGRMVAVTANRERAIKFGIHSDDIFDFWDWVGGRYSLWSAVGLSLRIAFGPEVIGELLAGAADMDRHFRDAPMEENLPVLMALAGVWNRNVEGYGTLAVIPYATALRLLPSFLQQLEMESNGKGVTRDGEVAMPACPVVWGTEGTNGQHAYFQWLHQGTPGAPVDFIAVLQDYTGRAEHHRALLANCFAQSEALMVGKSADQVRAETPDLDAALVPQKSFPGNRPSSTLTLDTLTARSLGELIALYEHKVFVQGVIWGVNSFDQWGVELGKVLAGTILDEMERGVAGAHDASTTALMGMT